MTDWPDLCLRLLRVCPDCPEADAAAAALLRDGEPWMQAEVIRLRIGEPFRREPEPESMSEYCERIAIEEANAARLERANREQRLRGPQDGRGRIR